MKFADFLKTNSLSDSQFAEQCGLSSDAVRLYRLGERIPREEAMKAIHDATGGLVQPNDFFPEVRTESANGEAA